MAMRAKVFKLSEVAAKLGMSPNQVRSMIVRAAWDAYRKAKAALGVKKLNKDAHRKLLHEGRLEHTEDYR